MELYVGSITVIGVSVVVCLTLCKRGLGPIEGEDMKRDGGCIGREIEKERVRGPPS